MSCPCLSPFSWVHAPCSPLSDGGSGMYRPPERLNETYFRSLRDNSHTSSSPSPSASPSTSVTKASTRSIGLVLTTVFEPILPMPGMTLIWSRFQCDAVHELQLILQIRKFCKELLKVPVMLESCKVYSVGLLTLVSISCGFLWLLSGRCSIPCSFIDMCRLV